MVTIPILLTIIVIEKFFTFIDGLLEPFYFRILNIHIPGIGFLTAIMIIFLIGIISTNVIGKRILQVADRLFQKIPVFKSIYNALRQITDAFSPESRSSFKRFVIVEYRERVYMHLHSLQRNADSKMMERRNFTPSIFLPTIFISVR